MKVALFNLLPKEVYMSEESLIYRLRKRAEIRRSINSRKSVQEGKPDRISDLLEQAADEIHRLETLAIELDDSIDRLQRRLAGYDY
jgi:transcriptional regulator GlxA family with amidase domain